MWFCANYLVTLSTLAFLELGFSKSIQDGQFVLTKSEDNIQQSVGETPGRIRRSASTATVTKFHVSSRVTSRYSRVQIASDVHNDANTAQEVSMNLKLPKTAFISNFSMVIDNVVYVGVVKEKAAARAQYEQAVARGESAGLVAAKVREIQNFAVSVNIAAGNNVTFLLNYEELLIRKSSVYKHVVYVDPGQVVENFKVEVLISESIGLTSVEATAPQLTGEERNPFDNQAAISIRQSRSQAYVTFLPTLTEQRAFLGNSDHSFTVTYDVEREELGGEILIRNGYFVHFFAPAHLPVIPKNVVFVIDKSGSMSGKKIRQTREALKTILNDLNENDKFNLITFSSGVDVWQANELVDVNTQNLRRARKFVNQIRAHGGTNLHQAAMEGVALLNRYNENQSNSVTRASMLFILTDGQPTSGITSTRTIKEDVKRAIEGRFSLFSLGFGSDVDHTFLSQLAHENQGISRQIYTDTDARLQLKGFYDEVASPLLLHVIMTYQGSDIDKITTCIFDSHFEGSEILVVGRMNQLPNTNDFLRATVESQSANSDVTLVSMGKQVEETFVDDDFDMEKIWAYLTIKDLLRNKTFLSDNPSEIAEIDAEVLRLSIKFNFVTPLTSMVVTKPGKDEISGTGEPIPMPRRESRRRRPHTSRNRGFLNGHVPAPALPLHYVSRASQMLRRTTTLSTTTTTTTTTPTTTTTTTPRPTRESTTPYTNPIPTDPLLLENAGCGERIEIDGPVNITSPMFPGLYPKNSQCVWQIMMSENARSDENRNIRLTFPRLDLEDGSCERDRILIYPDFNSASPGSSQVQRRCGFAVDDEIIDATQNIVVVFQSDDVVSGRGFLAHFNVVSVN